MIISDPSVLFPETPVIDATEARWAVEYLTHMIEKVGPDSPVGMVLMQTRRELASLMQSSGSRVMGPLRIAA
jgi:hypothetical protein